MTFAQILAAAETTPEGLAASIPETWMQGRTSYGGLSGALALVAAQGVGGPDSTGGALPPLRSAAARISAKLIPRASPPPPPASTPLRSAAVRYPTRSVCRTTVYPVYPTA